MLFELTNAPSTVIIVMNQAVRPFIEKSIVVSFDDLLVYNLYVTNYIEHLWELLGVLRREKLYAILKKCNFVQIT